MPDLSKIVLPVKNPKTGEPIKESFDIKGSSSNGSWNIKGEEATFIVTPVEPKE